MYVYMNMSYHVMLDYQDYIALYMYINVSVFDPVKVCGGREHAGMSCLPQASARPRVF